MMNLAIYLGSSDMPGCMMYVERRKREWKKVNDAPLRAK
jgi:hypothetical protein